MSRALFTGRRPLKECDRAMWAGGNRFKSKQMFGRDQTLPLEDVPKFLRLRGMVAKFTEERCFCLPLVLLETSGSSTTLTHELGKPALSATLRAEATRQRF